MEGDQKNLKNQSWSTKITKKHIVKHNKNKKKQNSGDLVAGGGPGGVVCWIFGFFGFFWFSYRFFWYFARPALDF